MAKVILWYYYREKIFGKVVSSKTKIYTPLSVFPLERGKLLRFFYFFFESVCPELDWGEI